MPADVPRLLLDEERIRTRVDELAAAISADYTGDAELVLGGVLKGAWIFLADLARRLSVPHVVDFVTLSSYREGTRQGEVQLISDLRIDLAGKHVLIVDDVIDRGGTLCWLVRHLQRAAPASIRSCILLCKPRGRESDARPDYVGFEIDDVWVVGYGLDHAERHRSLPFVGHLLG